MRVLDVSSSTGDLAFLARELVGEQGQVIGFDTSAGTVAYANERVAFRGLNNVCFVEAGFDDLPYGEDFDAIIGRLWPLGDDTAFVPGHGPMSTFGQERRTNPFVGDRVLARA